MPSLLPTCSAWRTSNHSHSFSFSPSNNFFSPGILQEPGLLQASLLICSARGRRLPVLHAGPFAGRVLCWVLPLPLGHTWLRGHEHRPPMHEVPPTSQSRGPAHLAGDPPALPSPLPAAARFHSGFLPQSAQMLTLSFPVPFLYAGAYRLIWGCWGTWADWP